MIGNTHIHYKEGYKYQLTVEYQIQLPPELIPEVEIDIYYIKITTTGLMTIRVGYAWDGASGPTLDTKSSMRGSLIHDVGYQLIRLGIICADTKSCWDALAEKLWLEDGMWKVRAHLWERALRRFGFAATRPSAERIELVAP